MMDLLHEASAPEMDAEHLHNDVRMTDEIIFEISVSPEQFEKKIMNSYPKSLRNKTNDWW